MSFFSRTLVNKTARFSLRLALRGAAGAAFAIALAPVAGAANSERAPDLSRLVVVGDSLTAGFQNFSLFDGNSPGAPVGGQKFGYPALIANQAGVTLTLPLISYPGVPPALTVSGGQIVRAAGNGFPEQFPQPFNLSVPGFTLADAFAHPFHNFSGTNPIDILSDIVFGASISPAPGCGPLSNGSTLFVSEVLCAVALQPTMIIVGIGNNDALQALTFGAPPTSKSDFAPKYHALMTVLAATRAPIVVTNIPDVTSLPFLVQAPAFRSMCGFLPAGATDGDFIVPDITNPNAINLSLCANPAVRPAALIAAAQAAVNAYNDVIKSEAKAVNAAVADFNKLFSEIAKHGYKLGNGQTLTAGFGGGLFSLDGIHPTNSGQAILANEVIKAINASFGSNIPAVSVDAIAQNDPLVPSP